MTVFIRILILCLFVMDMTACSYVSKSTFSRNKDKTYMTARSIAPLKIPPGIATSAFQASYPVPAGNYSAGAEDINLTPPGLDVV